MKRSLPYIQTAVLVVLGLWAHNAQASNFGFDYAFDYGAASEISTADMSAQQPLDQPAIDESFTDQDGCPLFMTLEICEDRALTFWASPCGQLELEKGSASQCIALWEEAQQRAGVFDVDDFSGVELNEQVSTFPTDLYDLNTMGYRGFSGSYAGQYLAGVSNERNWLGELSSSGNSAQLLRQAQWETNCRVNSCEEFIFEKYYEYILFEQSVAGLGDDYRAVFDRVYAADGLANNNPRGLSGKLQLALSHAYRPARNAYREFDLESVTVDWRRIAGCGLFVGHNAVEETGVICPWSAATGKFVCDATRPEWIAVWSAELSESFYTFDPQLIADNATLRGTFPIRSENWYAFHQRASGELADVSDARLLWLAEKQDEFRRLLAERRILLETINERSTPRFPNQRCRGESTSPLPALGVNGSDFDTREAVRALMTALLELDGRIQSHLDFAASQGCLNTDPSVMTDCDWSPRWLVRDARQQFTNRRSRDYQKCISKTANDFLVLSDEDLTDGKNNWLVDVAAESPSNFCADKLRCAILDRYNGSAEDVALYFSTVDAWIESLGISVDPVTGAPVMAQSDSDGGSMKDEYFAINTYYNAGWNFGLGTNREGEPSESTCDATVRLGAATGLRATAFGVSSRLLGLGVSAEASRQRQGVYLTMTVLGLDVNLPLAEADELSEYAGEDKISYEFNFVKTQQDTEKVSYEQTFWVGWIPFTFEAGLAGTVGVRTTIGLDYTLCAEGVVNQLSSVFEVEPFGNVGAYAEGLVGISGVAALGVRADITIVELSIPFSNTLSLDGDGDGALTVKSSMDIETELLAGQVSLVAELLTKTYRRRLFGFSGIKWTGNLFGFDATLDLGRMRTFTRGAFAARDPNAVLEPTMGSGTLTCTAPPPFPEPLLYLSFNNDMVNSSTNTITPDLGTGAFNYTFDAAPASVGVYNEGIALPSGASITSSTAPALVSKGSPFSYSFWHIDTSGVAGAGEVLKRGDTQGVRVAVWQAAIRVELSCTDRTQTTFIARGDNGTKHITLVHFGSVGADLTEVWVNGRLVAEIPGCEITHSSADLSFEGIGTIDEMLYFDSILTSAQIRELNERGRDGRRAYGQGASRIVGVSSIKATPTNGAIDITVGLPSNFATIGGLGTMVRASTVRTPLNITDGVEVTSLTDQQSGTHGPLDNGVTYYYRAFATFDDGRVLRGPSATATAVSTPLVVTDLVATSEGVPIRLRWNNPIGLGFSRIILMRTENQPSTGPRDGRQLLASYDPAREDFLDLFIEGYDRTYFYTLFAINSYGEPGPGVSVSATVVSAAAAYDAPPPPVGNLSASITGGRITLNWTLPNVADLSRVQVLRQGPSPIYAERFSGLASSFEDTRTVIGITHRYRVTAFDNAGQPSAQAMVSARAGLNPISGFSGVGGDGKITLNWNAPIAPADAVIITRSSLRAPTRRGSGTLVYTGAALSFTDTMVQPGQTYYYSAFTTDSAGNVSTGRFLQAASNGPLPPLPLSYLIGSAQPGAVVLNWRLPYQDNIAEVLIVKTFSAAATSPSDGVEVYTGLSENFYHEIDTFAYYTGFVRDTAGLYSAGYSVYLTPGPKPPIIRVVLSNWQSAHTGEVVTLNASGSYALDGSPLSFSWEQTFGERVALSNAFSVQTSFVVPAAEGLYSFKVVVSGAGEPQEGKTDIWVLPRNGTDTPVYRNPHTDLRYEGNTFTKATSDSRGYIYLSAALAVDGQKQMASSTVVWDPVADVEVTTLDAIRGRYLNGTILSDEYLNNVVDVADLLNPVIIPTIALPSPYTHISGRFFDQGVGALLLYELNGTKARGIQTFTYDALGMVAQTLVPLPANANLITMGYDKPRQRLSVVYWEATTKPSVTLEIFDISTIASPTPLAQYELVSYIRSAIIHKGELWTVEYSTRRLVRFDISDVSASANAVEIPIAETILPFPTIAGDINNNWVISGDLVFRQAVDLSDPLVPIAYALNIPFPFATGISLSFENADPTVWVAAATGNTSDYGQRTARENALSGFYRAPLSSLTAVPMGTPMGNVSRVLGMTSNHIIFGLDGSLSVYSRSALPSAVRLVTTALNQQTNGTNYRRFLEGNTLWMHDGTGLTALDISDPLAPVELDRLVDTNTAASAGVLRLSHVGNIAIAGLNKFGNKTGVSALIYDVSDPTSIQALPAWDDSRTGVNNFELGNTDWAVGGTQVYKISEPYTVVAVWNGRQCPSPPRLFYGGRAYQGNAYCVLPTSLSGFDTDLAAPYTYATAPGLQSNGGFVPSFVDIKRGASWHYVKGNSVMRGTLQSDSIGFEAEDLFNLGGEIYSLFDDEDTVYAVAASGFWALPKEHVIVDKGPITAFAGQELVYNVSWSAFPVDTLTVGVVCQVSVGTCGVENVNIVSRTAAVRWKLPGPSGTASTDEQLQVNVGNIRSYSNARRTVTVVQ